MPLHTLETFAQIELGKISRSDPYNDLETAIAGRHVHWSVDSFEAHGLPLDFREMFDRVDRDVGALISDIAHRAKRFPPQAVSLGLSALISQILPTYARLLAEYSLHQTFAKLHAMQAPDRAQA